MDISCHFVIIPLHPYTCSCHDCVSDGICGWCDNTCVHISETCSNNFTIVLCGCDLSPMITSISPDSGPTEGGTTVTITGTDLGTSFSDIISITVGSLSCSPIKDNYLKGSRVTCVISSSNQTQPGSVDVVVNVCNKEAIGQFRFGQPRVYSMSPSYGPAAGGTIVRIRGEDLNIGNADRTTVSLVPTSNTGRRKRQTMGTPSCDIM